MTDPEAAAAVIERAIADAVEQERARIVEWLRGGYATLGMTTDAHTGEELANMIECGDHKDG